MNPFFKKTFSFFLLLFYLLKSSPFAYSSPSVIADILSASKSIVQVHALTEGLAPSPSGAAMVHMEKTGAGVILDPAGIIVTNSHTVLGAQRIAVKLYDGREFAASVLSASGEDDLVLLKIESAGDLPFVSLADAKNLKPGDTVYSVGNSAFLNQTLSEGIILGIGQRGAEPVFLRINFQVYPGDSGTPVFGSSGSLYGITVGNAGHTTLAVSSARITQGYLAAKKNLPQSAETKEQTSQKQPLEPSSKALQV